MTGKDYQNSGSFNNEEINLFTLLKVFSVFSGKVFAYFADLYSTIDRNFKLIGAISALGLIAGIAFTYFEKPVYSSHAVISSKILSNEYCESLISELNYLSKEDNYAALQTSLHITHDVAVNIVEIKYLNFALSEKDSIGGIPFGIEVKVLDNKILDTLENALMSYLENNPYALKRKNAKNKILKEFAEKMHGEINDLDSLKRRVNKGLMAPQFDDKGKIIGISYLNPIETYKEVMEMYEHKLEVVEQITLLSNFEMIQGFTHRSKPVSPRKLRDPASYALFAFIVAVIFVRRRENKAINKSIQNQQALVSRNV